jgi:N-acetylmuramic acid 6-phosphate etherase
MTVTGVDYAAAARTIDAAGRSVKTAIVMLELKCAREEAERCLREADGFVRRAIESGRGEGGAP